MLGNQTMVSSVGGDNSTTELPRQTIERALAQVLSLSSVKSIIHRLFSILKSNFIHHHFCFYNV